MSENSSTNTQSLLNGSSREAIPPLLAHPASQHFLAEIWAGFAAQPALQKRASHCLDRIHALISRTGEHSFPMGLHLGRVGRIGALIAKTAGLSFSERLECLYGGWIHDVGKILIPAQILDKPGKLTTEEFDLMKKHVEFGVDLLADYPELQAYVDPVRFHHERWDGRGYPNGLKGLDIPVTGRVICLADAYDAMTNFRPYPPYQRTHREAILEIEKCAASHFDPYLALIFCSIEETELRDVF